MSLEREKITLNGISISSDVSVSKEVSCKRNKGKSILILPDSYILLDLETTGLNPRFDEIIEVACIKMEKGKEIDRFHSYIQPHPFYKDEDIPIFVDDFITNLTGITNDMLQDAPQIHEILPSLVEFLSTTTIMGHNVNFDINFLYDVILKYTKQEFQNDFIDTMRLARIILPDLPHHRLKDLCNYFKLDGIQHRALNDCLLTYQIAQNLYALANEKNIDLFLRQKKKRTKIDLTQLSCNSELNDTTHLFYNQTCVFTGKLERFDRKSAAQIVCNIGGRCENNITKRTNFLIIGGFTSASHLKEGKSNKLKKAEKLILEGQDLQILSEDTFYDLITDLS